MDDKKDLQDIDFNNMDEVNTLINKIVKEMIAANASNLNEAMDSKPFVYGFNIRVDKNGISIVEKDDRKDNGPKLKLEEKREPLVDVIDREKEVVIIAEIPGVEKDNIKIKVENAKLNIKAKAPSRSYDKIITLPSKIDPSSSKARYNNGVLEINIRKGSYSGNTINIEVI